MLTVYFKMLRIAQKTKRHKLIIFAITLLCGFTVLLLRAVVSSNNEENIFGSEILVEKYNSVKNFDAGKIPSENETFYAVERDKRKSVVPSEFQSKTLFSRIAATQEQMNDESFIGSDFDEYFDDRILKQRQWIKNVSDAKFFSKLKPKKILVQDGFRYYYQNGLNCQENAIGWESKCILVEDNVWTGLFRNLEEFDAVIGVRNWFYRPFESTVPRPVKQIFFVLESPYIALTVDLSRNNAFLGSYWRGSDIPVPYSKWIPFKNVSQTSLEENAKKNYAKGKTKLAAIVVSDCTPANDRLGFVRELQRYMPVDVYGKCGTHMCTEPCFETLKTEYKFYLAFENANCRDYITEKLYRNAFKFDMVPVVLGAHKKDYLYAAPPNSFIHVEDFESPSALVAYLKKLDQNDELYNQYFQWKSTGEYVSANKDFFCRACAALFMADYFPPPAWPKQSTWKSVDYCLPEGRWYWNKPNYRN